MRVHLVSAFGDLRLDEVGLAEIEEYKADKLTAGLAKKTINNLAAHTRHMEAAPLRIPGRF